MLSFTPAWPWPGPHLARPRGSVPALSAPVWPHVRPRGPSRKQAHVKLSGRGWFAEPWAELGRPPGKGVETQVVTAPKPGRAQGGGAPEPDRRLILGEGHGLLCPPNKEEGHARLPVDCLQPPLVCPPRSRGRREPRRGVSDRPAPQDTGREPGRGDSRKVHAPWSVFGRRRGWGPGSEGVGPRLVFELRPWAHPSPACSLLSALGKTTRPPARLEETRHVKPSDGARHTRKCWKTGGRPSQGPVRSPGPATGSVRRPGEAAGQVTLPEVNPRH